MSIGECYFAGILSNNLVVATPLVFKANENNAKKCNIIHGIVFQELSNIFKIKSLWEHGVMKMNRGVDGRLS